MFSSVSYLNKVRLFLVFVILLIIASAVIVRESRQTKTQVAVPNIPSLSFALEPQTVKAGENIDLILQVDPNGVEFHAFELYFTFDPYQVELQNPDNAAQNISSEFPLIRSDVDSTAGKITMIGTRLGTPFIGSENLEIGRIRLKTKRNSLGVGTFQWDEQTKLGSNLSRSLLHK